MTTLQPLPDWLKPITLTYQNTNHITTGLVQLPIPYSGPSIPLAWPYTSIDHHQNQITQPPSPSPTQLVHFYDGTGPFTVIDGIIITDSNLIPTHSPHSNPQPIISTPTSLPTQIPTSPFIPTAIIISTVYVATPSQPSTNSLMTNPNQESRSNSLTAIVAGFIILLILLVFVVLSLLFFLIRRQRQRQRRPIHLDSPQSSHTPYHFNSHLLPQHRHGSQTDPQQLNLLRDQHQWALAEPLRSDERVREKETPKPTQTKSEKRFGAWERLRHDFRSLLQHFSLDPSPAESGIEPDHGAFGPGKFFRNPYHDPSVSTETFSRVSRWWAAVRTPASSFLRAPRSFKTLSGEEVDLVEHEKPFAFRKTSIVSRNAQSGSGLPISRTPDSQSSLSIEKRAQEESSSKSSSSRPSKSTKSSRSSRKRVPDHPPLLEVTSEEDEDDRTDSPLEHLPHLSPAPFRSASTPVPILPTLNTSPSLSIGSRRVRPKKSALPNRTPGSSPYSISYNSSAATPLQHSPGRILVLKKRSDVTAKAHSPMHSPSSLLSPGHSSLGADNGHGNGSSPTLRFPLPPRPASGAEFVEIPNVPSVAQSVSTTTEEEEIVYPTNAHQVGPRRSSIGNFGGVSELGVFEDQEGSYVSEDLFYVRPKLARFKDGQWIEEGHEEVEVQSGAVSTGMGTKDQENEAQHQFPTSHRNTSTSGSLNDPESSTMSHVLALFRRSVSLPVSTHRPGELSTSGLSPLDRLAGEETDSEPEDERSRLLSRQQSSRYSRATLGQRLEVNSLRGSLANLSGDSGSGGKNPSQKFEDQIKIQK